MSTSHDFLLEIGTEELPAKALLSLANALTQNITAGLQKAGLTWMDEARTFATPRRLAVLIKQIAGAQPDRLVEKRGPAVSAAFDAEGKPTSACLGFASSCGISVEELQTKATDKGTFVVFNQHQAGVNTSELLPGIIREAVIRLPIPKPMRWANNTTQFIRPVHWVVMLFGNQIIKTEILGKIAGNTTYGHRYHSAKSITLLQPENYAKILMQHCVIADYAQRRQIIEAEISQITPTSGKAVLSEDLLQEITGLVEWPVALLCQFDKAFLEVPKEALETSMQHHQKCISIRDAENQLLPYFITISNIDSSDPQRVIAGNERVMRARLRDAQFFYAGDLKKSLERRLQELKPITFQNKLGSLYEKAQRIMALTQAMATTLNADVQKAARAGLLAKADLTTAMVGEFPELQGIMGSYYALHHHEEKDVALAIRDHYKPRYAGDELPENELGLLVSIADKVDTLVGIFGINQAPTGEKDPFALRRSALGALRIIIEKALPLDLHILLQQAANLYGDKLNNNNVVHEVLEFMLERLRAWYNERGISADVFNAVLACRPSAPMDFDKRVKGVQYFLTLPQASALTAANKRVSNILKKLTVIPNAVVMPSLFEHEAERSLANLLAEKSLTVKNLSEQKDYTAALSTLAELQITIDQFFDNVMVMVEDEKLRHNRLALLIQVRDLFLQTADISLLQG